MYNFCPGPFFNFEVLRVLSTLGSGGAELAECLDAIGKIKDGNEESWHEAWSEQAKKAESFVDEALESGDRASARDALLRAFNYTRASYYMMTGDGPSKPDPRVVSLCQKASDLYLQSTKLFDKGTVYPLEIPYDHHGTKHKLPGYLFIPPSWRRLTGRKPPIIIANAGADSLCQEVAFFVAPFAMEMGYAIVVHEGPGQGLSLHQNGLKFRPDWEVVTTAVIDHLYTVSKTVGEHGQPAPELDLDQIAVMGMSLGGYFALRAAAGDKRIKACVAIDPVHDLWDHATTQIPRWFLGAWEGGWIGQVTVDAVIRFLMRVNFQMKWNIAICGTFFGLDSPSSIMLAMKAYTLRDTTAKAEGSLLRKVQCPVFITGAGTSLYDLDAAGHTAAIYEGLSHLPTAKRQLWVARDPRDGGLQAKVGAVKLCNQKVFRFLDEQFRIERDKL